MSLTPLTSNLGVSRAKHLLRRACFHYNKNLLYTISELNAEQAIDYLLQDNTVSYTEPYDPLLQKTLMVSGYHRLNILQYS